MVDVNWRLDYVTKDSHLEAAQEPIYTVSLKTEVCRYHILSDRVVKC